ncbi:hypothetical protein ACHAXS_003990 [Conticribra weissflogii]
MKSNEGSSNDATFTTPPEPYRVARGGGQGSRDGTASSARVETILPELISDSSEPLPPEQIADCKDLEEGKKVMTPPESLFDSNGNGFDDVPIPPAQIAAQQEAMEGSKKKSILFESNIVAEEPHGTRKDEAPSNRVGSSSHGPTNADDLVSGSGRTQQSSQQRHQSNIRVIEATLVVEEPAPPVYNAILMPGQSEQNSNGSDRQDRNSERGKEPHDIQRPNDNDSSSFWRRHKLAISLGALAVLLFGGLMATVGALLASNNGNGNASGDRSEVGMDALPTSEFEPSPEPTYELDTALVNPSSDVTDDDVSMSPTSDPMEQWFPTSVRPTSNGSNTRRPTRSITSNSPTRAQTRFPTVAPTGRPTSPPTSTPPTPPPTIRPTSSFISLPPVLQFSLKPTFSSTSASSSEASMVKNAPRSLIFRFFHPRE